MFNKFLLNVTASNRNSCDLTGNFFIPSPPEPKSWVRSCGEAFIITIKCCSRSARATNEQRAVQREARKRREKPSYTVKTFEARREQLDRTNTTLTLSCPVSPIRNRSGLSRMHSYMVKNILPYLITRKMNNLLIISFNEKYDFIIRVGKATKINKIFES